MRKRFIPLTFVCLLLVCAGRWAATKGSFAPDQATPPAMASSGGPAKISEAAPEKKASAVNAQPEASADRKAFIDPITGRIVPPPVQKPALPMSPQAENAQSTSAEGLQEIPGTTRGGGIKVNLQGRFRSSVVATVGADGKVATRCQMPHEGQDVSAK